MLSPLLALPFFISRISYFCLWLCVFPGEPRLLLLSCWKRQVCSASLGLIPRAVQQEWVVGASQIPRDLGIMGKSIASGYMYGHIQ